jgi:uncharacterized repeat protein (TIGR01451 family)
MGRLYRAVGFTVLSAVLAGWAALARAQSNPVTEPAGVHPPKRVGPAAPAATVPPTPTGKILTAIVDEPDAEPGLPLNTPAGNQAPGLCLEWTGPPQARVGQSADYTLAVRNLRGVAVQGVVVRVQLAPGVETIATEPKAMVAGNVLTWELDTIRAKQEAHLHVRVVPTSKGKLACHATLTFHESSALTIEVTEPKLALKATAPETVMAGEPVTFAFLVSNPGDGSAQHVKVHALLSDGLEHSLGKAVVFEVGDLASGESRTIQLTCGTKATGEQRCEIMAEAEGDLKAQDRIRLNVVVPRLDLEAAGPGLRYLDRKAVYVFKVVNPGEVPATNVTITDVVPAGFKFTAASDGGRYDFATRTASWFLGEVGPGQVKEVKLEAVAVSLGEHHHKVTAQAARGLAVFQDVSTHVEGLSALTVEVVDPEDSIEVGANTTYEIRLTNSGSKTETDIRLASVIPETMQFQNAQGPTSFQVQGKDVVFEPLPKLVPRAYVTYRISVKALAPGDVRFKAQITSTTLVEPIVEMKWTRIYKD